MSKRDQKGLTDFLVLSGKIDRLSREHRDLKRALQKSQTAAAFYQSRFGPAEQIMKAIKKGRVKTPSFRPGWLEDEAYVSAVRKLCVEAVYGLWSRERRPTKNRKEIVPIVKERVRELIRLGQWNAQRWIPPGTDTIVRRLNQTADPQYYEGKPTPCISLPGRGGCYIPNPTLFSEPIKSELLQLAKRWRVKNGKT